MEKAREPTGGGGYAFGDFRFAPEARHLSLSGATLRLGARALDMLRILVARAGTVVTADELLTLVWPDVTVEETNLRVQIGALRKVLARGEQGRGAIETVPRGYRFTLPVSRWEDEASEPVLPAEPTRDNLPALLATTVGRAETIAHLGGLLAEQRLVTIAGPGGVGKTTVAVEVARQCLPRFADGICFVDFSSISDPGLVPSALASAFGVGVLSNDPLGGLISYLRKKQMLLLLDTCEHVVDAVASLVESLLSRLSRLRILATSREVLRATGEWAYRLPSLSHPTHTDGLTAADALSFPAVDFFVRCVRATSDRFELGDADADVVAAICHRLDGMPLAIEFAAARVGDLGLREISARLDDRFNALTKGRRTALPRHQTLAATLEWSYQLLRPEEQAMLRQLSVFRGRFTADAALAVAGTRWARPTALTYLSNIFAKSLVTVDIGGEAPLYRLLDTTRAFAAERLTTEESHEASLRHAMHMLASLKALEIDYESGDNRDWTEHHRQLIDDLRGAFDWALSGGGDRDLGLQLIGNAHQICYALSLFDEYARRLKGVLEVTPETSAADPIALGRVWQMYGHAMWQTAEPIQIVIGAFRTALELARHAESVDQQRHALFSLHLAFAQNGDYAECLSVANEYASIAKTFSSFGIALRYQRMMAVGLQAIGDPAGARAFVERVLADEVEPADSGRPRGIRVSSGVAIRPTLARILWLQGYPEQAWECACNGLERARAIDQAIQLVQAIAFGLVPIACWMGKIEAAKEFADLLLVSSLEHSLVLNHRFGQAYQAVLDGTFDAGREPPGGPYLADLLATMDEKAATEAALARDGDERWCTAEMLRIRAARLLAQSDGQCDAEAEALLRRSLDVARRQKTLAWELRTATTLAEHWQRRGRNAEALAVLSPVYERFTEGFDTRDVLRAAAILGFK
ncbi:winged helix-turn-helix domain-containing protein [Pendulispora rubella]|uniref:Winged helix-turn-helix domain-containing protein n=1 Tax=Pendulispora rubella TaxID=2741070 RepID=A0ABZ2L744_9BACT